MLLIKNAEIFDGADFTRGDILARGGVVERIGAAQDEPAAGVIEAGGMYAAPAFIDTHIHGYGGVGADSGRGGDLLKMSELLAACGVGVFYPTLYAQKRETLLSMLQNYSAVAGRETGAKIAGFHLEGPFISPKRLGAMKAEDIAVPSQEFLDALWSASAGKITTMTVAPEIENIDLLINFAKEKNILLQAGHTDASYEQMSAKYKDIRHVTHLFNAMSPFHHRAPGAAGAALIQDYSVEIISDGGHVHPAAVKAVVMGKAPGKVVLVSDASSPAGTMGDNLVANGEPVELSGSVFKRKGTQDIVSSALNMYEAFEHMVSFGVPLPRALTAATAAPAALHGLKTHGVLAPGYAADIIIFDKNLKLRHVILRGKKYETK